jgi:hypothetical protein
MERSGRTADLAVSHLEDLRELVARPGPFLTVVVARPEPIGTAIETTANDVRRSVRETGLADRADDVVAAIEEAFPTADGVAIVADADRILLIEHLDRSPRHPLVHCGALPVLVPMIERRAEDLAVVMAAIDRTGADLSWSAPQPAGSTAEGGLQVDGPDHHIRKVQGGGWSHRRFQQRAEDAWERTAREVAEVVADAARTVDARLVVLHGDGRMLELVRGELPAEVAELVREVPGSRAPDGSDEGRDDAARRWLRSAVAEDTMRALQLFDQEQGQEDRAAAGWPEVLGALRESRVDLLLVADRADEEQTAVYAPGEPTLVAEDPSTLEDLGAADHHEARGVDVAIRSALLTGADVRVVPNTPRLTDGIGAVLRW